MRYWVLVAASLLLIGCCQVPGHAPTALRTSNCTTNFPIRERIG